MQRKMNFRTKLLILLLAVGIIPLAVMGAVALLKAENALSREAFNHLESMREVKKMQVERYLQTIKHQIITHSEDQMIINAMARFSHAFEVFMAENKISADDISGLRSQLANYYRNDFSTEYKDKNNGRSPAIEPIIDQLDDVTVAFQYHYISNNSHPLGLKDKLVRADDASQYSRLHAELHPIIRSFLKKFGYYDIFLVHPDTGRIIYSVFKELDFATSLTQGPYAQTNIAESFHKANAADISDAVVVADLERYFPSYEAPAGFVASPIYKDGHKIGVLIFQFPIDTLNTIMQERAGMGKTGETYLVGSDKLMRSDSYLAPEIHSVVASFADPIMGKVDTKATQEALSGITATEIISDYRGRSVLSAYTPVKMGATTWALIAEIDVAEAFGPVTALKWILALVALLSVAAIVPAAFVIVKPLRRATAELKSAAEELQVAAQQQSTSATEQATATSEISTTMEELSRTAQQISAATANAASGSESAHQVSRQGTLSLEKAVDGISQIGTRMENITQNIQTLGEKSQQMGLVLDIINELADQTTILSFNASIEAAGAGEAGTRFAAVAEQIMNLANKAGDSTREIRSLIEDVQKSTNKTILITEEGMKAVNEGKSRIRDTASHFDTILKAAEESMVTAKEVEMTVTQQTTAIDQVSVAVQNVQVTADEVKGSTNQTLNTAQQLFKMADGLAQI